MEYVQTVLIQIEATNIDEASRPQGLLAELDEHRSFLQQQPGFQDMRVARSINAEGNVLLIVETRWSDDSSLVEYETREPTVTSIINKHQDLIVADSLQVLDMEALRTGAAQPPAAEAHERLALPLMVPVGILAFALLVIYGLSRIYLELSADAATGLAAGIAVAILLAAWYLASRPSVPGWQLASIAVVAAAALTGGALFAVVQEDEGEATGEQPQPTASPGADETPAADGASTTLAMQMGDNFFEFDGQQNPAISVPVGEEVSIDLTNNGLATHNMHVDGTDETYAVTICETGGDVPCSDPNIIAAGTTGTITFQFDQPGTYFFRCDFHPIEMTGTLEVR